MVRETTLPSIHEDDSPGATRIAIQALQDSVDRLSSEHARLNIVVADQTGEIIKLGAIVSSQGNSCNYRMGKVDSDIRELKAGRTEITQTHLRTIEAERDNALKTSGESKRMVFGAGLGFAFALVLWLVQYVATHR